MHAIGIPATNLRALQFFCGDTGAWRVRHRENRRWGDADRDTGMLWDDSDKEGHGNVERHKGTQRVITSHVLQRN